MSKGAYFVVHPGMSVFASNGLVLMAWRFVSPGPVDHVWGIGQTVLRTPYMHGKGGRGT